MSSSCRESYLVFGNGFTLKGVFDHHLNNLKITGPPVNRRVIQKFLEWFETTLIDDRLKVPTLLFDRLASVLLNFAFFPAVLVRQVVLIPKCRLPSRFSKGFISVKIPLFGLF
jgi:hypothetical protein